MRYEELRSMAPEHDNNNRISGVVDFDRNSEASFTKYSGGAEINDEVSYIR
jgi:hypothetical protein